MSYESTVLGHPSLVAYYKFDEPSGTVADDAKGTADLTFAGGVTLGAASLVPGGVAAATFARSTNGRASRLVTLPAQDFAVEGWFQASDLTTFRQCLFYYGAPGNTGFALHLNNSTTATGKLYVYNGSTFTVTNSTPGTTPHHFVLTRGPVGHPMRLYVDGLLVYSGLLTTVGNGTSFVVGAENSTGANGFNGTLDDISVYAPALTSADVRAHYRAGGGTLATSFASTKTGNWVDPATWEDGLVPGPADTAIINPDMTVTVTDVRTVDGWNQVGSGVLAIAGAGQLTALKTCTIGGDTLNTPKVTLAAGGKLLWNPGTGVTATIALGSASSLYSYIQARGTAGSRCVIGKTSGAAGTLIIDNGAGFGSAKGVFDCEDTDLVGLGTASVKGINNLLMVTGPATFRLHRCRVQNCGEWDFQLNGSLDWADTTWSGTLSAYAIRGLGVVAGTNATVTRCDFDKVFYFTGNFAGATPGLLTLNDNIFRDRVWSTTWDGAQVVGSGNFFCGRDGAGLDSKLPGTQTQFYHFIKMTAPGEGNPHFWGGGETFEDAIFEYHGPQDKDIGDCLDLATGTATVRRCLVLPSSVAGKPSGAFWWLNSGGGPLTVEHCTIYTGYYNAINFPHGIAMTAGKLIGRGNLFWDDGLGSGPGVAFKNDRFEYPDTAAVDALRPADATGNAFVGLGSDATNLVGGVATNLVGFEACKFSVAPTGNTILPTGGAAFVDPTRDFVAWSRTVRGHAGTDLQVIDLATADIAADKTLVRLSLIPWVRAGFTPQNPDLATAAHDGTTPGAVAYAETEPEEPLVDLDPARLAYWESTLIDRHSLGAHPYLPGPGYNANANEHYDVIKCMHEVRDYNVRNGRTPLDWSVQIAAGIDRFRDQYVLGAANGSQIPGHVSYTTGMMQHWRETADPLDVRAIDQIRPTPASGTPDPATYTAYMDRNASPYYWREVSYRVKSCLDRRRVGLPRHFYQDADVDILFRAIDHFLAPPELRYGVNVRVFYLGMGLRALIDYWNYFSMEATPDASETARMNEIPARVKGLLDYIWREGWYPAGSPPDSMYPSTWDKGAVHYLVRHRDDPRVDPLSGFTVASVIDSKTFIGAGPLSSVDNYYKYMNYGSPTWTTVSSRWVESYNGTTKRFYVTGLSPPVTPVVGQPFTLKVEEDYDHDGAAPALNLLVAHAYAWYYWYCKIVLGDEPTGLIYKSRHDQMFNGAQSAWTLPYTQKEWNQSVLMTPQALLWRAQADAGIDYRTVEVEPPDPEPTYTIAGPVGGDVGAASELFTIALDDEPAAGPITFTFGVAGTAGSFSPTTRVLDNTTRSATFQFIPGSAGTATLTATNTGGRLDPPGVSYVATAPGTTGLVEGYTFTNLGSTGGPVGSPSGPLRVQYGPGSVPRYFRFTFHAEGVAGTFTNEDRTLNNTFRWGETQFVPSAPGTATITVTNDGALPNPPPVLYTATGAAVPVNAYTLTLSGAPEGYVGIPTGTLTVALGDGIVEEPIAFEIAATGTAGTFSGPVTFALDGTTRSESRTFTPLAAGTVTFTVTDDADLPDPPPVQYTATPWAPAGPEPGSGVRLLLRRNATPGTAPAPESLMVGELGLNTGDGTLYAKLADLSVPKIGGPAAPVVPVPEVSPYRFGASGTITIGAKPPMHRVRAAGTASRLDLTLSAGTASATIEVSTDGGATWPVTIGPVAVASGKSATAAVSTPVGADALLRVHYTAATAAADPVVSLYVTET